jgi:hypothetical protein
MNQKLRRSILKQYPEWHNIPFHLSKDEMEHPYKVLAEFFDCYHLKDIRFCLKEWLHVALRPDEILQMNYLTLHDHILKLAESAWLLHTNRTTKSKNKKKNK